MMELMKFNDWVEIVSPPHFIDYIKKILERTLGFYNK